MSLPPGGSSRRPVWPGSAVPAGCGRCRPWSSSPTAPGPGHAATGPGVPRRAGPAAASRLWPRAGRWRWPRRPVPAGVPDGDPPAATTRLACSPDSPLPDRAETQRTGAPARAPDAGRWWSRRGTRLWSLAADVPARPGRPTPQVGDAWHRIYRLNRAAIGPDPDLIHPGPAPAAARAPARSPDESEWPMIVHHPAPGGPRAATPSRWPASRAPWRWTSTPGTTRPRSAARARPSRRATSCRSTGSSADGSEQWAHRYAQAVGRDRRAATARSASCCAGRSPRSTTTSPAARCWWPAPVATGPGTVAGAARWSGPRCVGVRTCFVTPERVEASIHVRHGQRSRAIAARFELRRRPLAVHAPWSSPDGEPVRRPASSAVDAGGQPGRPTGGAVALLVLLARAAGAHRVAARPRRRGPRRWSPWCR